MDLSNPNRELWNYLSRFIEIYDAVVLSLKEYEQKLGTPQLFLPAINLFTIKKRDLSEEEIDERLGHYKQYLDLFGSFETNYTLKSRKDSSIRK